MLGKASKDATHKLSSQRKLLASFLRLNTNKNRKEVLFAISSSLIENETSSIQNKTRNVFDSAFLRQFPAENKCLNDLNNNWLFDNNIK